MTHFKDRYTLDIFTHNIAMKRYCVKKDDFEPWMSNVTLTKISSRYSTYYIIYIIDIVRKNV